MEDCNYYLVDKKGGLGLWERVAVREIGDWMGFGLGMWERERIIKNCKRMNILLNKCVE